MEIILLYHHSQKTVVWSRQLIPIQSSKDITLLHTCQEQQGKRKKNLINFFLYIIYKCWCHHCKLNRFEKKKLATKQRSAQIKQKCFFCFKETKVLLFKSKKKYQRVRRKINSTSRHLHFAGCQFTQVCVWLFTLERLLLAQQSSQHLLQLRVVEWTPVSAEPWKGLALLVAQ